MPSRPRQLAMASSQQREHRDRHEQLHERETGAALA